MARVSLLFIYFIYLLYQLYTENTKTERKAEQSTHTQTRMWASAQCDGRPAEHRWRSLFNAAKFGLRPLFDCRAVTLPRRESRWNYLGCLKLSDRSQPLVSQSSPYCEDIWRRYCCLTSFFPIVDMCLICKDIARQICTMVRRLRFVAIFCVIGYCSVDMSPAACSTFQTCIINSQV